MLLYIGGVPLLRIGIRLIIFLGPADEVIPFMPQFIIIYFGCYLFLGSELFHGIDAGGEGEIPVFYCGFLCAAGMYAVLYFLSDHEYEAGSDRDGYLDRRQYGFCIQLISQSTCFRPFTAWQAGSAVLRSGRTGRFPTGIKLFLS